MGLKNANITANTAQGTNTPSSREIYHGRADKLQKDINTDHHSATGGLDGGTEYDWMDELPLMVH
jgi:hypothetical protein